MIYIGYNNQEKIDIITEYISKHSISKTYFIHYDNLSLDNVEYVPYNETIMYRTFYPLLQKLDENSLIILNECLRTQNRNDLTYNCIRHYLNRTKHQIIFQQLPLIDTQDDFMVLFDFDTQSRWKTRKFDVDLILDNVDLRVKQIRIEFKKVDVPTNEKTKSKYESERNKLFDNLGSRDPHIIPRQLHMLGSKPKQDYIKTLNGPRTYVTRNSRIKPSLIYGKTGRINGRVMLVDFPHRFIDFSDFIRESGQAQFEVLVTDLKVDQWYFNRYQEWKGRIEYFYTVFSKGQDCSTLKER